MTKISTKQVGISSVAEYSATVDQIAELTVRRDKLQAKLDKAILDAREEHGPELDSLNNQITAKVAMAETILRIESSGVYPSVSFFFISPKMRSDLIKKLQKPDEVKKDE